MRGRFGELVNSHSLHVQDHGDATEEPDLDRALVIEMAAEICWRETQVTDQRRSTSITSCRGIRALPWVSSSTVPMVRDLA
jgi:hypothetical protein